MENWKLFDLLQSLPLLNSESYVENLSVIVVQIFQKRFVVTIHLSRLLF